MKSACFIEHRNLTGDIFDLSERLYYFIERGIIYLELTDFYTDGAIGWDTLSAQTVLRLREVYPQIKLHLVLLRLVEYADTGCYCFWNSNNLHSGTAQTVRMAQKKRIIVVNFFKTFPV